MEYQRIKDRLLKEGRLFEDPEFPADNRSIYFSKTDNTIQWKRPWELTSTPQFVVGRVDRFDLDQGSIGNCWYIAAAATVACYKELFNKVVPANQTFLKGEYAGIFHFYFWRYGKWVEVVIDDRLPTYRGQRLCFCKNREEPNEFWSALLEKAYAKVHGSYEALEGGWTEDALVDFTGGVGERLDLRNKAALPRKPFQLLLQTYKMNTLMGCSITATKETMENELDNGLVIGHAYSVTRVLKVMIEGKKHRLVRLRNPWGRKEWRGPWSDGSDEWHSVPDHVRRDMGLVNDEDGEFWMSFEDWLQNFHQLQMCHLPPDAHVLTNHEEWHEKVHHGEWVKGISAGGCGNRPHQDLYWINPQYTVQLTDPDPASKEGLCTVVVSLMQKYSRLKRTLMRRKNANIAMGYDIYKLKENLDEDLDSSNNARYATKLAGRSGQYTFYREITQRFSLSPGNYVIIPSTFYPNTAARFLLRLYTLKDAFTVDRDVETGPILKPKISRDVVRELFNRYAGSDGVVDAKELRSILNTAFSAELGSSNVFELEACRSLLAMMDRDKSGVLEYEEVKKMWVELNTWKGVFHQFDKDKSGFIEVKELKRVFKSIGYNLSRGVLSAIVMRYGGKEGQMAFNDFIMAVCKVVVMLDIFTNYSKGGLKGKAELSLEEWMETTLYF